MMNLRRLLVSIPLMIVGGLAANAAPPHQVLPDDQTSQDSRLGPPKDLNGHFPFAVPDSLDAWEQRAEILRHQILVSTGLWPLPKKTPLNAVVHGKVQREGFTVEKVYFESVPNHFVTGLLFRPDSPVPADGFPAVLCPHGHGGRLQDLGEKGVRQEIAEGFERFESSGRFPAIARCAQLARMGCVTFIYDMIGYGDSQQISYDLAHRAAKQRLEMEGRERWGFYSLTAELRLQSIMGLQTWNSVRSLDFLAELPDVNPARMAVTGNSGGGTQTILLGAIDLRPIAFFPNGMVSTSMQGGCYCENCSLLRVGTGNVELTALFAPRPAGMTAVNDWTRDMMTDGYPQLQKLYGLYGKKENVLCKSYPHFPHNYNYVTRGLMYKFFNTHMRLGIAEPIVEEDFPLLTPEEFTVWNDRHPRPVGGADYEKDLLGAMAAASDAQLQDLKTNDPQEYAAVLRVACETIIGRQFPVPNSVQLLQPTTVNQQGYSVKRGLLCWNESGERVPMVMISKSGLSSPKAVTLLMKGLEKAELWEEGQGLNPEIQARVDAGEVVVGIDVFASGENTTEDYSAYPQRWINDARHYAAFNYGYNPTTFARRVHDVMSTLAYLRDTFDDKTLAVEAAGDAVQVVRTAEYLGAPAASPAVNPFSGFDFANMKSYRDAEFVPGALKYSAGE
jgi:hypothetical protein